MSKKKGKAAARKAPKTATRKPAASRGRTRVTAATSEFAPTSQVTIFLFKTGSGNKIRTAPQRAYAGPGNIEWTIVNLIDGSDVPVRITWVGQDTPFKPLEFRNRHSEPVPQGVKGVFKYVVHAYDTQEDPEVEIPWN